MISVFTYGTLEIPEVMETVTGQSFPSFDATAHGFVRYLLKGKIYPGMTVEPGVSTLGRVYVNMNEQTLTYLDAFEDEVYMRESIEVSMPTGETRKAFAYLIPLEARGLLSSDYWDKEKFLSNHFPSYLQSCRVFHDRTASKFREFPCDSSPL